MFTAEKQYFQPLISPITTNFFYLRSSAFPEGSVAYAFKSEMELR